MRITDYNNLSRVTRDPFGGIKTVYAQNTTSVDEDALMLTRHIAYKIVAPLIVATGLFGNILTMIILRNPIFRGVMYNFFLALAVFDFLSLLFSISAIIHLLHPVTPSYVIAVWYSYLEIMVINGLMGTSVLIVVCITFDRYMSACHPFTFKTLHTGRFCKFGILCSGFVAFLVWMPTCFLKIPTHIYECDNYYISNEYDEYENSSLWVACQLIDPYVHEWYNVYAWIREMVISFIPIVVVIILNGLLVKYFVKKQKHPLSPTLSTSRSTVANHRLSADKNLKSLLKAIIISFLITILPAGIFNASYSEKIATNLEYEIFRATANNLELLNHALNFYLYILLSKSVRSALPSLAKEIKSKLVNKLDFILRKQSIKSRNQIPESRNQIPESSSNKGIERDCRQLPEKTEIKSLSRQTQDSISEDYIMETIPKLRTLPDQNKLQDNEIDSLISDDERENKTKQVEKF